MAPKVDSKGRFVLTPVNGWDRLRSMLDPKLFDERMKRNLKKATQLNALIIVKEIRKRIQGGGYSANAALTTLLKGSSKPLIGPGDNELFKAITHQMVNESTAFIGVLRSARSESGKPMVDVAGAVHEGVEIVVTDAMRGLFLVLAKVTTGDMSPDKLTGRAAILYKQLSGRGPVKPLKASTTAIRIPPRPFIRSVFEDPTIKKKIKANWMAAIALSYKGKG